MISLECLRMPGKLPCCPLCLGASRCEELCRVISKLAGWCGIDASTGKAKDEHVYRFDSDAEARQDLFTDTLLAMEKEINTFAGRSKMSTWVCQILNNKKKDYLRKRSRERNLFQHQPVTENDDEPDWAEWASTQYRDPELLEKDPLKEDDIATALRECFSRIMIDNKNCADLLVKVFEQTLQLLREDAGFEHSTSGSINFKEVLHSIAHEYKSFAAVKRRFYRCRNQLEGPLRRCLGEMGYGKF